MSGVKGRRRTCIGCRHVRLSTALMRVVRQQDDQIVEGLKLAGRGAWLCADSLGCVDLADRRKAFGRALRGPVSQDSIDALRASVVERARIGSFADNDHGD